MHDVSKPVAIVTGAASGIGLAVTEHLLSAGYKVAMADVDPNGATISQKLGPDALFVRSDISDYTQQAALFQQAFKWGGNRLDFFHANAGIDDRQSIYEKFEDIKTEVEMPLPLNVITLRVDLEAVIQGVWLFRWYANKNAKKGGKVVITSSAAGLYPMATNPLYTAAKSGLIGFTRACGPTFTSADNITVNCICPAFVPTNLCPPHMRDLWPKEHITPMSTVLKAMDMFLGDDKMTGQVVELTLNELQFREKPEYANDSQRWIGEKGTAFWQEAYEKVPQAKHGV